MLEPIEVVYENGVLRPVVPLPGQFRERQHLTVLIETSNRCDHWLDDADPGASLAAVRQALAKAPGTLAEQVRTERDER